MNDVQPQELAKQGRPKTSLTLGIISLFTWMIPILGFPTSIIGLVLGVNSMKGNKRGIALAGVILNSVALVFVAANIAWGAYLGATGQHAMVNKILGKEKANKTDVSNPSSPDR